MGTFRLILALCVVVAHAAPLPGVSVLQSQLAVKSFFLISGFYMALILGEKYPATPQGRTLFYTNRLLRIYPMYLVTLVFALLFYAAASIHLGHPVDRLQLWADAWKRGSGGALSMIALSQGSVVGLDVTPLLGYTAAEGFSPLWDGAAPGVEFAWRFNFLPHCWSIGAELLFYAMAPFLVRLRTRVQALLCAAGLPLVIWIAHGTGPLGSAAAYHLGILQVPYFLLGILACTALRKSPHFQPTPARAALPLLVLAGFTFSGLPVFGQPSGYLYILTSWLAIPILFHVTWTWAWDRWLGEFSYPIYLLHVPVKWILLAARGVAVKDAVEVSGWALMGATLAASGLMVLLIDRPMERFRRRRFEQRSAPAIDGAQAKS